MSGSGNAADEPSSSPPAGRTLTKIIRKTEVQNTFATIFHAEFMDHYKLGEWNEEGAMKLLKTLKDMEAAKIKTVMYSVSWDWFAPNEQTLRWAYMNDIVNIIIDMLRSPGWLFRKHPDSRAVDSGGRSYSHMSWFHTAANRLAIDMLRQLGEHMVKGFPGCVVAIQPVYNNEYEAKFTQEYDSFQDYNAHAQAAFRNWLRSRRQSLVEINRRWGTGFRTWAELKPPPMMAGMLTGIEEHTRYWDWMRFRVEFGASVFNRACAVVQNAGLKCYHHFPEFFSVLDAMYGASMFHRIAASKHTDFLIMDSNFMTPYRTVMNPVKLRIYVAAAHAYNKPVYFEAAVERFANFDLLKAGYKNAMMAGAPNMGLTNWLNRIELNASLTQAMYTHPPCKVDELVGVFIHLDSCSAWTGLQQSSEVKDPLHNLVEDLAEKLTVNCTTDIAVYVELDRFTSDIEHFTRAVFVEPLFLYGSNELLSYAAAKMALKQLPHQVLHLPAHQGFSLKVIEDL
ncbi:hypothetical protein GPECTOR_5g171 [Gonium pectorale]|uniref:Glycoside hydrolase family 42 N-terminal domain-containing protein n=1 Tax=Gonium pectorale TaxID=33097 RepID=A0A150GW83_GONPE|nr:hypothetical protein GPECTOR_5g171 [Gonium pectorale]|eukprot:KXZ54064.1 hypothetical protein GPECTOR_5g171 [Gonium pectorale]